MISSCVVSPALRRGAVLLLLPALASPAWAQWTPVPNTPVAQTLTVWANGDTLAAGADTTVSLSTDGGANWTLSARPRTDVQVIDAVWMRNGRLYAGTFGQGVFVSDDLGTSWIGFNEGLVGGVLNSQLSVTALQLRGTRLYAATAGAGVYERDLATVGTWHPYGDAFEPNQASNVVALALGGDRLLATGGANGQVFYRDPGDADWTVSNLDNLGLHPGLTSQGLAYTGRGWVVGSNLRLFTSLAGQEPWTILNPGFGAMDFTSFATQGHHLFAAIDLPTVAVIQDSDDDGTTWQNAEGLPNVFVFALATSRFELYAARGDGLWRRPIGSASVPRGDAPHVLRFALAGPQPFGDHVRLRFELPAAGAATLEVFDVMGRSTGERLEGRWPAGPQEVSLDARPLGPGVYAARLITAAGATAVVRLVHVR